MNMRMHPRAAGMGATRIVHQGLDPRSGINQPGEEKSCCSKKLFLKKLILTSPLPGWRKLPWNIQLWSLHSKIEVNDDHKDDGDDDGKVWDVRSDDGGKEALTLEAFEGVGDEVGPDEEQAAHEKYIGHVPATWGRSSCTMYILIVLFKPYW